jgi:hypothetical protein
MGKNLALLPSYAECGGLLRKKEKNEREDEIKGHRRRKVNENFNCPVTV